MLNYTNTNRFFIALLMVSIGIDAVYGLSANVYLGLYLLYTAIFFYGVFNIEAGFFTGSLCSGATTDKEIALSFDDGPSHYTPEILQVLQNRQIKAAFFCIGSRIETKESIFRQIHEQGHLIGNHSYSHHLLFDFFLSGIMLKDLQRMDAVTTRLTGLRPRLFRPPYGVTLPWLNSAITRGGYLSIGWTNRSLDTVIRDENKLLAKAMASLKPGAVYLFHDTNKTTLDMLPKFIERVTAEGYRIERLDKMLDVPAYK